MTSPRRPSLSFVVAVLALLVATGSTSYAAGLARNSVGTAQLKPDAVTTVKIKNGSVTAGDLKNGTVNGAEVANGTLGGADLADGSVGLADLALAARPPADITFARQLGDTGGDIEMLVTDDFKVRVRCDTSANLVSVIVERVTDSEPFEVIGVQGRSGGNPDAGSSVFSASVQVINVASEGQAALASFQGAARRGTGPWTQLVIAARVDTFAADDFCLVRLVASPGR